VPPYELDVPVVDEKEGLFLGRPWITCLFDCYSKGVIGFQIEFKCPDASPITQALKQAGLEMYRLRKEGTNG